MSVVIDERGQPATDPCTGSFCHVNDLWSWRMTASSELTKAQGLTHRMNGDQLNALRVAQKEVRDPSVVLSGFTEAVNHYASIAQSVRLLWESAIASTPQGDKDDDKDGDKDDDKDGDTDWPSLPDWNLPSLPSLPSLEGLGKIALLALLGVGMVYSYPIVKAATRKRK